MTSSVASMPNVMPWPVPVPKLDVVLRFWVYSLNAALSYWRIEGFRIPNEEMADYLERAVPLEVHELLNIP